MTSLAERVIGLFVAPPAPTGRSAAWEPPVPVRRSSGGDESTGSGAAPGPAPGSGTSVVLGPAGAAEPVAAALANELRRRAHARAALLIVWEPWRTYPVAAAPAWPAARRLAERLRVAEPAAVARGRLVQIDLPPGPEAAAARIRGLIPGEVPAVLALAGPRPAAFERVLAEAQLVVVVADPDRPPAVTALAAEELASLGSVAWVVTPPSGAIARAVARAGLGRLRRLPSAEAAKS